MAAPSLCGRRGRVAGPSTPLRARFPTLPTFVAAGLGLLILFPPAEAYRFFAGTDRIQPFASGFLRPSEDAVRWSSESWGPGATLVWEIPRDPDFDPLFGGPAGALPHFRTALEQWSSLPDADISWQVRGSVGAPVTEGLGLQDGRNTFYIDAGSAAGGYASLWVERSGPGGPWELYECDFALGSLFAQAPRDGTREATLTHAESIMSHELGHCLGLAHAASFSLSGRLRQEYFRHVNQPTTLEYPLDPSMSYGIVPQDAPPYLAADDETAAALLRPAAGWRATTGNLSGSLTAGGAPAPWVHVWALPVGSENTLRNRIGSFSDENGDFVIEGLAPGDYWLWSHPLILQGAHGLLTTNGAPIDLDDTVRGYPLRVTAGRTENAGALALRIGRTGREPPSRDRATGTPGSSIVDRWGTVCSGIRARATRPYPADGPHAATAPDRNRGGDVWYASELTLEWGSGAAGALFDWAGLYRNWQYEFALGRIVYVTPPRTGSPFLDLSIPRWDSARQGNSVRHTLEIVWPESAEATLRFRAGPCGGGRSVVCTTGGCGIR